MDIVAIPLSDDDEAIEVQGGYIRIQVKRTKVDDNDLDSAAFGTCTGYLTVYPGYISKRMEPPQENIRTYWIDWCTVYRDEQYYFIKMRYTQITPGDKPDFFWGRFG